MSTMEPLYAWPSLLPSSFTMDFQFYDYYHINCSYPALSFVFYSTSLLFLSYHTMSTSCLISLVIYLLAPASLCLRHGFQCMIMIRFYRYTCAHPCTLFGIRTTTCWGVLTPLDPHVQVLELGAC